MRFNEKYISLLSISQDTRSLTSPRVYNIANLTLLRIFNNFFGGQAL